MNENHPVLFSLGAQLEELRQAYAHNPSEQNRYQLVRLENLIQQWAPDQATSLN